MAEREPGPGSRSLVTDSRLEREVVNQPYAFHGERAQAIGGGASRGSLAAGDGTGVDRSLDLDGVGTLTDIREDEIEGVGTGRLDDQVSGQIERAGARRGTNGNDAVADVLSQLLHSAVERHPKVTITIGVASQDIGSADRPGKADLDSTG